jgi:hypothetical protein
MVARIQRGGTEGGGSRKVDSFFPFNDGLNGVIIISDERILLGKILRFIKVFTTVEYLLIRRMPAELRRCSK